jgi:glycerol-3-phosphate acyltransferase PlsY
VGHCFPFSLQFRGGKGVASGLGAFLLIAPLPTSLALVVFLLEILTLRFVSLGSILGALAFGFSLLAFHLIKGWYSLPTALLGLGTALLLVARHHRNIRNLMTGTESTLWGKGKERRP